MGEKSCDPGNLYQTVKNKAMQNMKANDLANLLSKSL